MRAVASVYIKGNGDPVLQERLAALGSRRKLLFVGKLGWAITNDFRAGSPARALTVTYDRIEAISSHFSADVDLGAGVSLIIRPRGLITHSARLADELWWARLDSGVITPLREIPLAAITSGMVPVTKAQIRDVALRRPLPLAMDLVVGMLLVNRYWALAPVVTIVSLIISWILYARFARGARIVDGASPDKPPPPGTLVALGPCDYLGGYGADLRKSATYQLCFTGEGLYVRNFPNPGEPVAYLEDVKGLGLGGAGEYQTGGGFVGGGFGLQGAAEGIIAASLLNALTTRTHRESVISVSTPDAELYFVERTKTPQELRIDLAQVLARTERGARLHHPAEMVEPPKGQPSTSPSSEPAASAPRTWREDNHASIAERLHMLSELHRTGSLSDTEFAAAKIRLLTEQPR